MSSNSSSTAAVSREAETRDPSATPECFATLDAIAQGVLVVAVRDCERSIVYANSAFTKLTGYEASTVRGRDPMFLTGTLSDPVGMQQLREALSAATSYSGDMVLHASDDRPLSLRISLQPVREAAAAGVHVAITLEDLSRVARMRESLRTSEARLQLAMDASRLSMWDWNIERDEVSYNDHWRVSLGIDPADLLRRDQLPDRLMLPSDQPALLEQFERHFHGATQYFESEYPLRTATGDAKWFLARAQVVRRDAHGKAIRMIGVLRDISRSKRELQQAADVQERWERAVRGTSDGLYDWNLLTGHVWYAARFREIIGYADTEFPDTFNAFQNVLHADDRTLVLQKIRKHLENQMPLDVRCRVVTSSGALLWCRMRGQANRDAAGKPSRLAGSISDISAQIAAEEALGRSQNFYGTILDSLPFYIAYVDRDERIAYANRQFQEFFHVSLANNRGRTVREVLGNRRYAAIGPNFREALRGGTVESHGRFRGPARRSIEIEGIFLPHFDDCGEILGCFVAARDVTEKRQLEAELRQSQKMEAVGRLTGGIAHDFNNLLAVIVGNMQLLGRALRDSPVLLRQTDTAMKAAMRGAELTRRLLAFARQQMLEPRVVDLNTLINGMYDLLHRSLTGDIEIQRASQHGPLAGEDRSRSAGERHPQSGHQCARCHARGRSDHDWHTQRNHYEPGSRSDSCQWRGSAAARRIRCARSAGHRHRDVARSAQAGVRAVFHHQGRRQGEWPGAAHGVRFCTTIGRARANRERGGIGHPCAAVPAAYAGECRTGRS